MLAHLILKPLLYFTPMSNDAENKPLIHVSLPKPRIPKDPEAIRIAALNLDLKTRVALRNVLTESIDTELAQLREGLASAEQIVKGEL